MPLEDGVVHEQPKTPLPLRQLFIVSLLQGAEPLTSSIIFPFVNQAVRESGITGGDETKTGYYAGAIESIFFVAECLTVVYWGRLSDRIGRKPVMLIGLMGLAISMITFGLSKSYWLLFLSRFIQGMSNGNMGMTKNIIAEITDESNIADAFACLPLIWSIGGTVGPIIGGTLSNPATSYPSSVFSTWPLFIKHPYLLPCMVAAVYSLVSLTVGLHWLDEVAPAGVAMPHDELFVDVPSESTPLLPPSPSSTTVSLPSSISSATISHSTKTLLAIPSIRFSIINLAFLAFADQSCQVILPLFFSTPTSLYGLALRPYAIGVTLGAFGILNGFIQVYALGWLTSRFGSTKVYQWGFAGLLGAFSMYVVVGETVRIRGEVDTSLILASSCQLVSYSLAPPGSIYPILVSTSPTPSSLATITALGQMATSTMRSVSPSFASSLFAFSMQMREYYRDDKHRPGGGGNVGLVRWLAGNLVYFALLALVSAGIWMSGKLPRSRVRRN
ncbi:MFS general substrate transporter [Pleurotus eryngii]|uniref:MFS general substrate transporter n=1 Tax=Pleurotus eryngii TaxID=5323 RepID=A0A9P6A5I3_PLEER|nr:MFS general substrate transporter [Pleurotus eryngii]